MPMRLSDGEKLILVLLSEIHDRLSMEGGIDTKLIRSAIYSGNLWALKWELSGILHDSESADEVLREVVDILDMWSFLERGYAGLSPEDKARIAAETAPLGSHVRFTGFDGNNEAEYMNVAGFLVDELGRFSEFKGRDLNAHMPTLDAHRRMLAVFMPLRRSSELSATDIVNIVKARIHPEHRRAAAK